MTIQERFRVFIKDHLKMKISTFEEQMGWSNGYIRSTKMPSMDKIEGLALKYPELNLCWLYFGEGEMIRNKENLQEIYNLPMASEPVEAYKNPCDELIEVLGRLKEAREIIDKRDKEIQNLNRELGELKPKKNNSNKRTA